MRGTTSDNGTVAKVLVNGQEAKSLRPNFAEWEVVVAPNRNVGLIRAHAVDAGGQCREARA